MTSRTDRGRFAPGQSGNPAGRPRGGLRRNVSEAILDDWATHGVEAVRTLRKQNPAAYMRLIARFSAIENPLDYLEPPKQMTVRIIEPNGRNVSLEEFRGEVPPGHSSPDNSPDNSPVPGVRPSRIYD